MKVYGVESISFAPIHQKHADINTDNVPKISFVKPSSEPLSMDFKVTAPDPKLLRMLFGNKFNKPTPQGVYKFKIKNKKFARPVYQRFVFPKHSIKGNYKTLSRFVKIAYS